MEGIFPLHRRVAGIDVHRMLHVVTVLIEQPDGSIVFIAMPPVGRHSHVHNVKGFHGNDKRLSPALKRERQAVK